MALINDDNSDHPPNSAGTNIFMLLFIFPPKLLSSVHVNLSNKKMSDFASMTHGDMPVEWQPEGTAAVKNSSKQLWRTNLVIQCK